MTGISGGVPARHNPFATEWTDAIPFRFPSGSWDFHLGRLRQMRYCAAIVGRKGSGKTTLLDTLVRQLPPQSPSRYVCIQRCPSNHRRTINEVLNQKNDGTILMVDGMQRLSFANCRRLLQSRKVPIGGLIVTAHRRCALPTWIHCQPDQASLQYVLTHLGFSADSEITRHAEAAFVRFRGNVREVLRWLYDQVATGQLAIHGTQA